MELTDLQKGYLACFIDTDGSIQLFSRKPRGYINRIGFFNTNLEALELMQSWIGMGSIYHQWGKEGDGRKPGYALVVMNKRDLLELLIPISPHLVIKYDRAQLMMDWCLNGHSKEEKDEMVLEMKELNKKGRN